MSHPNLSDEINRAMDAAKVAPEINLSTLSEDTVITFRTRNTLYRAVRQPYGWWLVSGNPKYFAPEGTLTRIVGSTFEGSMIKVNHIFVGGHIEVVRKDQGGVITTSQITSIGEGPTTVQ